MLRAAQIVLPGLAAALFLYGAAVCLRALFGGPGRGLPAEPGGAWPAPRLLLRAAGMTLAAGGVYWLLFAAAARRASPGADWLAALQNLFYANTDARHYIDLARFGYGAGEVFPEQYLMIVFFPLFPVLVRVGTLFGLVPYEAAALLVQLPLAALAGAGLYALVYRHFGAGAARWAVAFWLLCPGGVFFFAPMTESLFLALTVWYAVMLERRRWGACAVLGVLAGLARAPGVLLGGMAAVWLFLRWRREKRLPRPGAWCAMLGPAAGLGGYFALNQAVYGSWQQYAVYQKEHWHQALGLFTDTVAYHLRYLVLWWQQDRAQAVFISLAAVLCILAQLALLAGAARRLPPHWLAYGLAYTAVTTGVSWLLSAPRYAAALFCLPASLAVCGRGTRGRAALLAPLAVCGAVYTLAYLAHAPVY